MTFNLLLTAIIIIICVICNKISDKIGVPMLLAFIFLGMFFGSDGIVKINFDDYVAAEQICTVAMIFIMFYGGFGTKWNEAKKVAAKAILLSSLGTIITAALLGLFCHYIMKISLLESFLIGAVISSTDAASVFSILRFKKLNLRYNTASLLEIESGSNDPFSYMLTITVLTLMNGNIAGIGYMMFSQIVYGILSGVLIAILAYLFCKKIKISSAGFSAAFFVAVAVISYSVPTLIGGNGFLSVYITGIVLGNLQLESKAELVHFFNGTTGLMQMLLFFILGLLCFPSKLPGAAPLALCIALILTFVARPIAVFAILAPFKSRIRQQLLVSFSGMRGAASIVFAIMTVTNSAHTDNDIFHIVFCIVLFSILFQGTLLPAVSKLLNMTDARANVMKTFNDYTDEVPIQFIKFTLPSSHNWTNKPINKIILPPDSLIVLILREDNKIVPNGRTILRENDTLILSGKASENINGIRLYEKKIEEDDDWHEKTLSEVITNNELIIIIRRNGKILFPSGNTLLQENDVLVIAGETKSAIENP